MEECKIVIVMRELGLKEFFNVMTYRPKEFIFEQYGTNKFRVVMRGTLDDAKHICRKLNTTVNLYTVTAFMKMDKLEEILIS